MSNDKQLLLNPLFLKYQSDYEKNPKSRVFAPLAETYRKLGMTEKAMEILSQGIRFHPTYVMGYLGLAFCYFDIKQFVLAYNTLRPLVESNRDNIRLQKLFGDICIELKHDEEALETYKYLLFINPRDKEIALKVQELEEAIENRYQPNHRPIYIPEQTLSSQDSRGEDSLFDVSKLDSKPIVAKEDFDDWMALDLNRLKKSSPAEEKDLFDDWNLNKGVTHLPNDESSNSKEAEEEITFNVDLNVKAEAPVTLERTGHLKIEKKLEEDEEEIIEDKNIQSVPLVTHTLVDLYCGQGHIEKALEVLERILILNPNDQKTINKISEIKKLMGSLDHYSINDEKESEEESKIHLEPLQETSEEDGRKNLMDILDQKLSLGEIELEELEIEEDQKEVDFKINKFELAAERKRQALVEEKLNRFLIEIKQRALDYHSRI